MIEVRGDFDQLIKDLQKLNEKELQKALSSGLTTAAKPVKLSIKQNTPKDKRVLVSAVGQKVVSKRLKSQLGIADDARAIAVGLVRRTALTRARYEKKKISVAGLIGIIEKGSKPHVIKAKGEGFLNFARNLFAKKVYHPGSTAQPFLQKAYDSAEGQTKNLFFQGLQKWLDKHAA